MSKVIYIYGVKLEECNCGVWKAPDFPCWNETDRQQMMVEAIAALRQSVRNLGYTILKEIHIVK